MLAIDADPSTPRGIRLLELGAVTVSGSGCICLESALLCALMTHILSGSPDLLVLGYLPHTAQAQAAYAVTPELVAAVRAVADALRS